MNKARGSKALSDGVSSVAAPWNFDDQIRSLESGIFPDPGSTIPKDRSHMASNVLQALAESKIYFGESLTEIERTWLADLMWNLSDNRVALRALGYKSSKGSPDRDLCVAEDYFFMRASDVRASAANELIVRKWSESESNIKRLIGIRAYREAARARLKQIRAATTMASRAGRAQVHREMMLALVWRQYALRNRDGRISQDAQAAANEIERLTAPLFA